ncbi:MAG TPA: Uma2 family endonuclease [Chloroflexota bacterium]|nr:Uma2 family endonuclease [Chloroflexota bacterium]
MAFLSSICRFERHHRVLNRARWSSLAISRILLGPLADRLVKIPHYACAGIPEVWLIDLDRRCIERHSVPTPEGYASVTAMAEGQSLPWSELPALVIRADDLLG